MACALLMRPVLWSSDVLRSWTWTSSGRSRNILGVGSRGSTYFTRDENGTLVSRRSGATRDYYLFDALGSIYALTGSAGTITQRYDYDPYGAAMPAGTGQLGAGSADVPGGQFGFAGGYKSTAGPYHYGQRYYDPALMRWTQPDPLDQTGDLREGNRYLYAGAAPTNSVDPSGLFSVGIDAEVELGPVRFSGGVSLDDDGNLGVTGGVGGGAGVGGGVKGTVNPFGKVENGGEIEGGGCVGPGIAACYSASSRGGASAGIGGGAEAGIAYRHTRRIADLW